MPYVFLFQQGNNHTVWSTPIQREKNKRSRKVKTTFPHQPLPRLLLLLNALLLAQLLGQRWDKVASNAIVLLLESAAIEDGVQDFPVSPEISISLAFFFVNCVFLFYIWFKFFLTILIITEEKKTLKNQIHRHHQIPHHKMQHQTPCLQ